jgi:hypothetical protein
MSLTPTPLYCPECGCQQIEVHKSYTVKAGNVRQLYYDRKLFQRAIRTLINVINTTGDLALITDGERRYGQVLFELCSELVRTGKRGRPPKTLPKDIQVRVKNKGSRAHKRGCKRPK